MKEFKNKITAFRKQNDKLYVAFDDHTLQVLNAKDFHKADKPILTVDLNK